MILISMFMEGRNNSKSIIMEVEVNLYGKLYPGRLCPIGIPRPNPGYKTGISIQETETVEVQSYSNAMSTYATTYATQKVKKKKKFIHCDNGKVSENL